MAIRQKFCDEISDIWRELRQIPTRLKRRIWNKRLLLWWYRLWIRKNSLHRSLDLDEWATSEMNDEELKIYLVDLRKRRFIAHERDFWKNV